MRLNHLFIGLIVLTMLSACGDSGGNGKGLFSSWSSTSGSFVLDLSDGDFGTFQMGWLLPGGAQCVSDVAVGGTEETGSAVVFNSEYIEGSGGGDPNCSQLDESYTYTKTDTRLTICDSNDDCNFYQ